MKKWIHEGRLGIERSKARVREALYWPSMSSEITEMISRCSIYLESRRKLQREPMQPFPPATGAWTRVGTDLFKMQGQEMLALHGTRLNARQRLPPYSRLPHQIPRNKSSVRHHKRYSHQAHKVDIRETRHSGSGYIRQWSTMHASNTKNVKKVGNLNILHRVPIIQKRMVKLNGQSRQ